MCVCAVLVICSCSHCRSGSIPRLDDIVDESSRALHREISQLTANQVRGREGERGRGEGGREGEGGGRERGREGEGGGRERGGGG